MRLLFPDLYYKNVQSISLDDLKEKNIHGLILDVDNTLIDFHKVMPEGIKEWVKKAKEMEMKICILSNTNNIKKIQKVSNELQIPYIGFAKKPFKQGFIKVIELLGLKSENIAVIGDQLFTDILGGNRMKMTSIFVEPIDSKDIIVTRIKRPIERLILKYYLKKQKKK